MAQHRTLAVRRLLDVVGALYSVVLPSKTVKVLEAPDDRAFGAIRYHTPVNPPVQPRNAILATSVFYTSPAPHSIGLLQLLDSSGQLCMHMLCTRRLLYDMLRMRTTTQLLYNMSLLLKRAASDEALASLTPCASGPVEAGWLVNQLCLPLTRGGKSHKRECT